MSAIPLRRTDCIVPLLESLSATLCAAQLQCISLAFGFLAGAFFFFGPACCWNAAVATADCAMAAIIACGVKGATADPAAAAAAAMAPVCCA